MEGYPLATWLFSASPLSLASGLRYVHHVPTLSMGAFAQFIMGQKYRIIMESAVYKCKAFPFGQTAQAKDLKATSRISGN